MFRGLFYIFLIVSCLHLAAQDSTAQESIKKKSFWARLDSARSSKLKMGKSLLTPFIAPSYTPEMQFLITAGGLYSFKTEKENALLERSSLPFSVGISTNGSVQITGKLTLYGKGDKTRAIGELWYKDMPDNYFGVGYENGRNRELSDETTGYQRRWWKLYYKLVRRVGSDFFVGGIIDLNETKATELNPFMASDSAFLATGEISRNSGIGFDFQYDTRDLIVNAYSGMFLEFNAIFYGVYLNGQNRYQAYELDYRQYANMGKPRRTLAWQVKTRATFGDTPWSELSQLGSPFDLRGYRWGRFRDESMIFGLLEYRHMFNRKRPNKKGSLQSKSGFALWVGTGSIGESVKDYSNWLPNYGVGYRFETEPRMNVRIDYGFGVDSDLFYITFTEAF